MIRQSVLQKLEKQKAKLDADQEKEEIDSNKVKVGLSPSQKNCVICFTGSPLKMMKNAFYFILKALFVLKIFKFLS